MAHLTTDFIKIAQVGPSVDGRFIKEEWVRDMAATYNPGTYTALLWPEHCRWFGNLGEVIELKAEPDEKGVLCLFARFKPNASYLEWNAAGQGLFYSVEVAENFAGGNQTYLEGLGVTDSPASLGMQSTRFSARPNTVFISNVPLEPPAHPSQQPDTSKEANEVPGWFKRTFPFLFTSDGSGESPDQKEPLMDEATEARITTLEEGLASLAGTVADLSASVAGLEVDVAAGDGGEPSGGDPAYKALAKQFGHVRREFAALSAKLSAPRPGTPAAPNSGPAGGKKLL